MQILVCPCMTCCVCVASLIGVLFADLERVDQVRTQIPIRQQQRADIYLLSDLTAKSDA
jgi:hypothetical protein